MASWDTQLEEDLDWRMAELGALKVQITSARKGSLRRKSLLRSSWAMLYAHYEGFCKFAHELYVDAVKKSNRMIRDYSEIFILMSMDNKIKNIKEEASSLEVLDFCVNGIDKEMREKIDLEYDTENISNLWPNVLHEMSEELGVECSSVNYYSNKLGKLVNNRNDIAHGEKMTINSFEEFKKYENAALTVMHDVAISVLNSIENKKYLSSIRKIELMGESKDRRSVLVD